LLSSSLPSITLEAPFLARLDVSCELIQGLTGRIACRAKPFLHLRVLPVMLHDRVMDRGVVFADLFEIGLPGES
jgi:hypothetical protein